jgi:hypothetical protein
MVFASHHLDDVSAKLRDVGRTYNGFQRSASAIGQVLGEYSSTRSEVAEALYTDIAFAICYSLGVALLLGGLADWLTRAYGRDQLSARAFSAGAWIALLVGVFDLSENFTLLRAFYEYGTKNHHPDVNWWGYLAFGLGIGKWIFVGIGVVVLLVGVVGLVPWVASVFSRDPAPEAVT